MTNIEHELRGILSEEEFGILERRLQKEAVKITEDSKDTYFFVAPKGMILKVVKTKEGSNFISFKIGDEAVGGLEEYEIPLKENVEEALKLFNNLGLKVNYVPQTRTNYFLENGFEISMKHTPDWGYHFEIEYMGGDESLRSGEILRLLEDECIILNIKPMTPIEVQNFIHDINKKHNFI